MRSVYTPTVSTFYHAIFTLFCLVMDFSPVRFVFMNILFFCIYWEFNLSSNILPEKFVIIISIHDAQFYSITSFLSIENIYLLWLWTDIWSLLIHILSCTENKQKYLCIFSREQSLVQYCYVNASMAWKDRTYGPFWSLISERQQTEKILSSTQDLGVFMPSMSWTNNCSGRVVPGHSVFLRQMQWAFNTIMIFYSCPVKRKNVIYHHSYSNSFRAKKNVMTWA